LFSKPVGIIYPAWSLSIEVIYYFTPLVLRRLSSNFAIYALVASGLFGAYRLHFMGNYVGNDTHGISVLALYWAWLAGWIAHGSKRKLGPFLLLAGTGIFCVVADPVHYPDLIPSRAVTIALDILFWAAAIFYLCYVEALRLPSIVSAVFDYLGELSYPLYLVHWPLFTFLTVGFLHQHPRFAHPELLAALALLCAALIYTIVDRPMRSGRRPWMFAGLFALLVIFAGLAMAYHR
jgi:peptidoglycan/LPS O-acetylase OafA/YrhL